MRAIVAAGGDSNHFPSHNLDCCLAAWVAGADWLHVRAHLTRDGVPVLFETDDLSAATNVSWRIGEHDWAELASVDTGHAFQRGADLPWRRVREPFERDSDSPRQRSFLTRLDALLRHLPEPCGLAISVDKAGDADVVAAVARAVAGSDLRHVAFLTRTPGSLPVLRGAAPDWVELGYEIGAGVKLSEAVGHANFDLAKHVFCDGEGVDVVPRGVRIVARVESARDGSDLPQGVALEVRSALAAGDELYGRREVFAEDFRGNALDRSVWMSGISGGFETPARFLHNPETGERLAGDSREEFDTRLRVDNGLVFDIRQGKQYASAAVVTRFPFGGDFWVEVDWTYDNPQRATMMLLGFLNTDAFVSHRPEYGSDGEVIHPRWSDEHQIFDTHGNPPFVSMEHEENDGTRIICNRVDSGLYRWYNNFYQPNIGNGTAKTGRFRLMRRGHYYAAYYQDPANPDWVGVGALENGSMNDRLYVRMGAKHYPKRGAPDPLPANLVRFWGFRAYKRSR